MDFNMYFKTGSYFDTIRDVNQDGWIVGDFVDAPAEDCRLKQPVPEGFKKKETESTNQ